MCINKLENFMRRNREQTDREQRTDRQTENSKPEATLIPWIVGVSGPILGAL